MLDHTKRIKGIGGSDCGAVLGKSRWKTPADVYFEKIGLPPDTCESVAMELGTALEPWLLKKYAAAHKVQLETPGTVACTYRPWMVATPDALIKNNGFILEIKTARKTDEWGEEGSADIPLDYLYQVSHYMAVFSSPAAKVFVLFKDRDELAEYCVPRDPAREKEIIEAEEHFWKEYVVKKIPPPAVSKKDAEKIWPSHTAVLSDCGEAEKEAAAKLKSIKEQIKSLEKEAEPLEGFLCAAAGSCEGLRYEGKTLCTWKNRDFYSFDSNRFKKHHADLYQQYIRKGSSRVFLLK